MNVQVHLDDGRLRIQQVDPAELSAGQFAHIVRTKVESHKVRVLVIGEALRQFQGILTGVPIFTGAPSQLMQAKDGTGQGKQEG